MFKTRNIWYTKTDQVSNMSNVGMCKNCRCDSVCLQVLFSASATPSLFA